MQRVKQTLRQLPLLTLGTFLVAAGVYFFKFPNHFSMGGVSGLSILLGQLIPAQMAGELFQDHGHNVGSAGGGPNIKQDGGAQGGSPVSPSSSQSLSQGYPPVPWSFSLI